jgi:hypothetical protein
MLRKAAWWGGSDRYSGAQARKIPQALVRAEFTGSGTHIE